MATTSSPWRSLTKPSPKAKKAFISRASARARMMASPKARFNRGAARPNALKQTVPNKGRRTPRPKGY